MLFIDLAKRIVLGIVIATGLGLAVYHFLWQRPERWNGKAESYLTRATRLAKDSVSWQVERRDLNGQIAKKDSVISKLSSEARRAQEIAQQWQSQFNSAIALKDATVDRLSDSERELAYFKALQKNGTLAQKAKGVTLSASAPEVVAAGLKTANREEEYRNAADNLSVALGALKATNDRLGKGLLVATGGLSGLSSKARAAKKGGLWPFNRKRRKQLDAFATSADSLKHTVEEVSELERELSKN